MSLQDSREKYARHRGRLVAADSKFIIASEKEYDGLKEKNAHPSDFRRLRNKIANVANGVANKPNFGDDEQAVFDGLLAFVEMLDKEIDNRITVAEAFGGYAGGRAAEGSGWRNAVTGDPVRIFSNKESVGRDSAKVSGVSIGEILASKVLGLPASPAIQNALQEGTNSAGGYTVPVHTLPQFIDRLRSAMVFSQAGARTMLLDTNVTKIAKITGDPTANWRAESASIALSDPTFGVLTFAPQSLSCQVKMSRELLMDSVNISDALEVAMLSAMSLELDRACLLGSGSSNQPLGLFGTSGINTVSMGTNGAAPTTFDNLLDAVYALELSNARGMTAAIWHPRTARTYRKMKDTTGQPLRMPEPIDALPKLATTAVPITQTQGTNSDCSTVFFGNFPSAIVGIREQLHIQMLPERYADTGEVGFIAHMRADVQFEHPEEFCTLTGVR